MRELAFTQLPKDNSVRRTQPNNASLKSDERFKAYGWEEPTMVDSVGRTGMVTIEAFVSEFSPTFFIVAEEQLDVRRLSKLGSGRVVTPA
jgi:hypothetical protein